MMLLLAALLLIPLDGPIHVPLARIGLRMMAKDANEVREMERLAWEESRWRPMAVSPRGACGLWQVIPRWWGGTCRDYQARPVWSAYQAIRIKREMERRCGATWKVCYRYGPSHPVAERARRRGR